VNSLPKTVTGQRRDCDLNPGPSAPESSALTTRLPSHRVALSIENKVALSIFSIISSPHRRVQCKMRATATDAAVWSIWLCLCTGADREREPCRIG